MAVKKIVIAGGSGYIGSLIARAYKAEGYEVIVLSRARPEYIDGIHYVQWNGRSAGTWSNYLEGAMVLVNLTGKNVNCRYTAANKKEILESRVFSVRALGDAIRSCSVPPAVWIQAASATIYRHAEDRPMDEHSGEYGSGFSVEVCKTWEQTFFEQETPLTRKAALRIAIVLGKEDGAFPRLKNLAKVGLGGKQGNGRQMFSWIAEEDLLGIIRWVQHHENATGVYNCSAPGAVTNDQLMRFIRSALGIPLGLPAGELLLKAGAWLIGTETELILKSRWVVPARLISEGYTFAHSDCGKLVKTLCND